MPAIQRVKALARDHAERLLRDIGRELRSARVAHGLSQRSVASLAGISQAQLSMIERGLYGTVTIETLALVAAAIGLELSLRLFPGGQPIRDKAHIAVLSRFRKAVSESWSWAAEVPLPIPGDKRAWDRVLRRAGLLIGVEAETRPMDLQELQRRVALKKRDGEVDRVILVLADTDWNRRLVRLNDLEDAFPISGKLALRLLAAGRDPGGDALILV